MAASRRLAAVPDTQREQREEPPDLRDSVRDSLSKMDWLADSDAALKALVIRLAGEIEGAIDRAREFADLQVEFAGDKDAYKRLQRLEAMCDVTKTIGWLGPQLQGMLRDLGGTPAARLAMKADKPIGGRLANLRAAANTKS
jgi:hypothetical protein